MGCCAFICGVSFGASQCRTGALGQIWPIPYLSALKTIAFDYPVTNAILANTFGYDAGYMARALCFICSMHRFSDETSSFGLRIWLEAVAK